MWAAVEDEAEDMVKSVSPPLRVARYGTARAMRIERDNIGGYCIYLQQCQGVVSLGGSLAEGDEVVLWG